MKKESMLFRFSQLVWLVFGVIEGLLGLRFLLKLLAANPANAFASWVYGASGVLLEPFQGLTRTPAANGMVFDLPALVGMLVYMLLTWGLLQLLRILIGPTASGPSQVPQS